MEVSQKDFFINQIPYDYTEEVRNRFKGLDLIECLMNYGQRFMSLYRRQGSRPFPWKRNAKKIEENNRMGKIRDFFKKIRDTKETFHAKMGSIKDRNGIQ